MVSRTQHGQVQPCANPGSPKVPPLQVAGGWPPVMVSARFGHVHGERRAGPHPHGRPGPAGQPRGPPTRAPPVFPLQVLFKLVLGSAKFGEAALFLSVLGVFNVLFVTCVPVVLYFTRVEYWSSFDAVPWGSLCGFSVLLLSKWHSAAREPPVGTEGRAPSSSGSLQNPRPTGDVAPRFP